jgi:membrane fusion protein (multidrug efflux system)
MARLAALLAATAQGLDWPPYRPLMAVLFTAVLLGGCGDRKSATKGPPPPPEVVVVPAKSETIPVVRQFVGTVQAFRSVEIRARVEGILEKRSFTEGTDVKKGQLLYTIDPAQFVERVRDVEGVLAQAQAVEVNARAKAERLAPLVKEDAISKQDYDDAVAQLNAAQAQVESARANLQSAKLNLGYTRVVATEDGRIGVTQVPEGRLVGRGEPTLLATIDRIDPIYVNFTMSDVDALLFRQALERGQIRAEKRSNTARIVLPDGSELAEVGRIDFTEAQVNPQTGTITLRAVLPNPKRQLLPGMMVTVYLTIGSRPNAVLIPQQSVVKVPNGQIAWVVGADNKVERRDLVLGEWVGSDWVVEKGLQAGERVVVDGLQRIQPGVTVRIASAAAAAPVSGAVPAGAAAAKN